MIGLLALAISASDVRVVTPPRLRPGFTVSEADYPPATLRQGVEGAVGFEVTIDPDGTPSRYVVTNPVSPVLDERTCAIVVARMRFTPARNRAGQAVTAIYRNHVRWNIDASAHPFADGSATIAWPVIDGKLGTCVTKTTGFDKGDLIKCDHFNDPLVTALVGGPLSNYSTVTAAILLRIDPAFVEPAKLKDGEVLHMAVVARFTVASTGRVDQCTVSAPAAIIGRAPALCDFLKSEDAAFVAAPTLPPRAGVLGFYVYAAARLPSP